MARQLRIAAPRFETRAERGHPDAPEILLRETAALLDSLRPDSPDLVVLSEGVGAVGMTVETAEEIDNPGPFIDLYRRSARQLQSCLVGTLKLREDDDVYNAALFVAPDGEVLGAYRKSYLTRGELDAGLTPGPGARVTDTPAGRIGAMICFDLNFRPLRDAYADLAPDLLVFPSMFHGGILQRQWAVECRCHLVSAMQVEGGGIIDPFARPLARTHCYTDVALATINLDYRLAHLDHNREALQSLQREFRPHVTVDVPPNIGRAMIVNHTEEHDLDELIEQYDIELLEDYLESCRRANEARR